MALMFWRTKAKPEKKIIDLDEAAFSRWIRAQRPPWEWFLTQSMEIQEALAQIGDEHSRDLCLGIGWSIRNPDDAALGADALNGNIEAEEALAAKAAANAVSEILQRTAQPVARSAGPRPLSMSGFGQRVAKKVVERQSKAREGKSLFGRLPDPVEPVSPT